MKNRIIAMMLALCLVTGSALADTLTLMGEFSETSPMRYWDVSYKYYTVRSPWLFALERQVPDIAVEIDQKGDLTEAALLSEGFDADVVLLQAPYDWPVLWQSGQFAELTDHAAVASLLEQTYPRIAESVMNQGRVYAVPVGITTYNTLVWQEAGWQEAGLTDADIPASFTALLDFLEGWPKAAASDRVAAFSGIQDDHALVLAQLLIQHYALQCGVQAMAVDYTRDDFVAVLERCLTVGRALDQHTKGQEDYALFAVASGDAKFLPQAVTLGMSESDPAVVSVTMNVIALRADSAVPDLAETFLECYLHEISNRPGNDYTTYTFSQWEHEADLAHAQLFVSADQPVLGARPFSYPVASEMLSTLTELLAEDDLLDVQRADIEPWIATAQQAAEVLEPLHWYYSEEVLNAYKAVANAFCPGPVPEMDRKDVQDALRSWAKGSDTSSGLGINLNKLLTD